MGGNGTDQTAGSCFYITLSDEAGEKLNGRFTAFGQVISGWQELDRLASVPLKALPSPAPGIQINEPIEPEYLRRVTVETFGVEYGIPERLPLPR